MTPQKAIKFFDEEIARLNHAPELNGCEMTDEWKEQLEICGLAKSALEKQIPKKTTDKEYVPNGKLVYGHCPVCNTFMDNFSAYCNKCGQAIDWSDT